MKKTFVKATLFSLMLGTLPVVTLTGCKDYDGDIDNLTQRDDNLQKEINDKLSQQSEALGKQISALETSLESLRTDATNANNAAKKAADAAAAAQAAADQAQKAGDSAKAAADQADAKAQAANAEALAAQAAAANAKADAIAETVKQVQALRTEINNQIDQLKASYGEQFTALTNGLANAATAKDLDDAVAKLEASIASSGMSQAQLENMLSAYLTQINVNTTNITALSGRIDGIDTSINSLTSDLSGKIGANAANITKNAQDIAANNSAISANTAEIAKNALAIQTEASRINDIINTVVPGIDQKIAALDTKFTTLDASVTAEVSALNTALTNANTQIAALNTFKTTYESLLQNLSGIDFADIQSRLAAAETKLTTAQADIVKNAGDITTINGKIVTIDGEITSIKGLITALQQKDTALDGDISGINGKITTINGLITGLQQDGQNLDSKISGINGNISTINGELTKIDQKFTTINGQITSAQGDITKVNAALSTLSSSISKRLTSVSLVPTSYVGGIPSIEFYTATYTPLGKLDTKTGIYAAPAANAKAVSVNNDNTQVLYRLNPAGVTLNDIVAAKVDFVQQTATSRAAADNVIKVTKVAQTEDGILAVTAVKNGTASIDEAPGGKIYTVALKVPIAEKNYMSWTDSEGKVVKESAEDAVVYSEYCRISDTAFTPEIGKVGSNPVEHFTDATIWTATPAVAPAAKVSFVSEGYDLNQLATGCMKMTDGKHVLMTADQLKSFGFTIEFSVPANKYEIGGVNQQEFASIKDGILTPVTPKNMTQADRVGKTPIISVVMKQGDYVVAQRFFTIEFIVGVAGTPEIVLFNQTLGCNDIVSKVDWTTFTDKFINQLGFPMTKAEFLANYSLKSASEDVTVNLNADEKKKENVIVWTLPAEDITNLNGKDKDFDTEIVFESSNNFPDLTLKLSGTVLWPTLFPTFGETINAYWNDNTMYILPVAMPDPYTGGTATYNTNVLIGRVAPYLDGLLPCAKWDVVVKSINAGDAKYKVNNSYTVVTDVKAPASPVTAARLWYGNGHTGLISTTDVVDKMNFYIYPNAAGIALVENTAEISLEWDILLNGQVGNDYALNNTKLKIVKPLKSLNTKAVESLEQNAQVQYRELANGLTITDCFNKTFEKGTDYWKYYGITNIDWAPAQKEMTIETQKGKVYNLADFNMTGMVDANGKLTFTGSGIQLQESVVLNVPVEVTHKWGVLETSVQVTIEPFTEK